MHINYLDELEEFIHIKQLPIPELVKLYARCSFVESYLAIFGSIS